jgi:hypothetical protein
LALSLRAARSEDLSRQILLSQREIADTQPSPAQVGDVAGGQRQPLDERLLHQPLGPRGRASLGEQREQVVLRGVQPGSGGQQQAADSRRAVQRELRGEPAAEAGAGDDGRGPVERVLQSVQRGHHVADVAHPCGRVGAAVSGQVDDDDVVVGGQVIERW